MKMIFLIDGDNNIGKGLQGIRLLTEQDSVLVFYGKGQTLVNVQRLCAGTRANVQYLESVKGGKNSIDFQIITELGVLVGRGEADFAYVISQDKGYEAAMSALRSRYASTFREVALRPSIQDCVLGAFLLRTNSREELEQSLCAQYGDTQGAMIYAHLAELFAPEPEPEPEPEPVKKPVQRRKRTTRATAKAKAETVSPPEPEPAPEAVPAPVAEPEPEAVPQAEEKKTAKTHRSRARRKRPAQETPAE